MRVIAIAILMLSAIASCRPTRKITEVVAKKDSLPPALDTSAQDSIRRVREAYGRIASNKIEYSTFSSKIRVDYKDSKGRSIDFNVFVRMRKDSVIWASIIGALGVEGFRVLIDPDSVVILDKLEKTVQRMSVSGLQELTQLPFDFKTLQELLVGNPVYMEGQLKAFREEPDVISMSLFGDFFKHLLTFKRGDMLLQSSKLDDIDSVRSRTAKLVYEDYQPNGRWMFSGRRQLTLAEKTRIDVSLEYRQVEFDQPQSYPFSIPKNYKLK
jgi:hypothetical protein